MPGKTSLYPVYKLATPAVALETTSDASYFVDFGTDGFG